MADYKITGEASLDTSKAEASMESLGKTAKSVSDNIVKETAKASGATKGIGEGFEQATTKVSRAEQSIINSIKRTTTQMELLGKTASEKLEFKINTQGLDPAKFDPLLRKLKEVEAAQNKAASGLGGIGEAAFKANAALAAIGVGVSFAGIVSFVKNTVDGIDALNDLKDATGASIENLSALEDVAKRTGSTMQAVESAMVKFNKVLFEGAGDKESNAAKALDAIGLSAKELSKIDPAEALRQTAVALAGFADDANKARLVQELFGKSIKEVAPFLKDLAEQGSLVAKVTAQQADEAEKFNKQLFAMQANIQEASRWLAGPLVKSINETADAFRKGSAAGESFFETAWNRYKQNIQEFYNAKSLSEALMAGTQPYRTPRVATGTIRDEGAAISEAVKSVDLSGLDKVIKKTTEVKDSFIAGADAAREWGKYTEQFIKAADAAEGSINNLTKTQGTLIEFLKSPAYLNMAEPARQVALEAAYAAIAVEQLGEATKAQAKAEEEAAKAMASIYDASVKNTAQLQASIESEYAAAAAVGLNAIAVAELEAAKLSEMAASKERQAVTMEGIDLSGESSKALRAEAKALRDLGDAKLNKARKEVATDEAKKASDEWKKAAEKIEQDLTDALMRGFESGKGFAEVLRDTVVNMFKTMVLRPIVSAIVSPVAGAITGSLGLAGAANAASGIAGGAGLLSGMGAFGSGLSSGLSAWGAEGSVTGLLSSGSSLFAGGIANGLGTIAGALGPIALGVGAVYALVKSLDDSGTYHTGGLGSYSAAGGAAVGDAVKGQGLGFDLASKDYTASGQNAAVAMAQAVVGILDSTAATFGQKAGAYAATAFADDTSKDGAWGALMVKLGDQIVIDWKNGTDKWPGREFADGEAGAKEYAAAVAKDVRDYLVTQVPDWADDALQALGDAPSLENLGQVVGQINTAAEAMLGMGRASAAFAALSETATSALIRGLGGAQSASGTLSNYYGTFYSEDERQAITRKQLQDGFTGAGLGDLPSTIADYRAIVDKTLAEGNTDLAAALIKYSDAFASTVDSVDDLAKAAKEAADELAKANDRLIASADRNASTYLSGTALSDFRYARSADDLTAATGVKISGSDLAALTPDAIRGAVLDYLKTDASANAKTAVIDIGAGLIQDKQKLIDEAADVAKKAAEAAANAAASAAADAQSAAFEAANAYREISQSLLDDIGTAQIELMRAQGDKEGALAAERAKAIAGMDDYQVSLYDTAAAIRAQITALEKQKQVTEEAAGLQQQIYQLEGNTAAARAVELAKINEANRPLQERIWALEDEKVASEKAKEASEKLATAVGNMWSAADSAASRYLSGSALEDYRYTRITDRANALGAGTNVDFVKSLGVDQIKAGLILFTQSNAAPEAKQAVIELGNALLDLKDSAQAAIDGLISVADSNASKFLSGAALEGYQYQRFADRANALGAGASAGALQAMGVDQVRDAVLAFVNSNAAPDAKKAVIELGASIIDLKDAAAAAMQSLLSTADSNVDKFLSGAALNKYKFTRFADSLREVIPTSTVTADLLQAIGINDVQDAVLSFVNSDAAPDAKKAIIELGSALIDLKQSAIDAQKSLVDKYAPEQTAKTAKASLAGAGLDTAVLADLDGLGIATWFRDLAAAANPLTDAGQATIKTLGDLTGAVDTLIASAERFADAQNSLSADKDSLNIEYARATGNEKWASVAERAVYMAGFADLTTAERERLLVIYDQNQAIRAQITDVEKAKAVADERKGLERQLLDVQGDTAAIRALERTALSESNRALYDQINALTDAKEAAEKAAEAERALADERKGLERQLLEAQGNTAGIRQLELAALNESNRPLLERIFALQDEAAALEKANAIAAERKGIEQEIAQLLGDTAALRGAELAALDSTNRSLKQRVYDLTDASAAVDAALAGVGRAIDAQRTTVQEQAAAQIEALRSQLDSTNTTLLQAATETANAFEAIGKAAADGAKRLRDQIAPAASLTAARAYIDMALSIVRAGGKVDQSRLSDAIGKVTSDSTDGYATLADFQRAQAVQAGKLDELSAAAGTQKSLAQQTVDAVEASNKLLLDQIKAIETQTANDLKSLDGQLKAAQAQVDAMRGVDTSVKSVADAILGLNQALAAYLGVKDGKTLQQAVAEATAAASAANSASGAGGAGNSAASTTTYSRPSTEAEIKAYNDMRFGGLDMAQVAKDNAAVTDLFKSLNNIDAIGGEAYRNALSTGQDPHAARDAAIAKATQAAGMAAGTLDTVHKSAFESTEAYLQTMGKVVGASEDYFKDLERSTIFLAAVAEGKGLPSFAVGINNVPYDMTANLHKGEAVVPAKFNPFNPGAAGSGNAEMVAELKALRVQNERLEAKLSQIERHSLRTANATNGLGEAPLLVETV